MQAYVCRAYGGPEVLVRTELPIPTPRAHEVLIKVRATTVTAADVRVRAMRVPPGFGLLARLALGLRGPRQPILGTELAGDVVAVGSQVTNFVVGDPVIAFTGARMGCYAAYVGMAATGLVVNKPPQLTYEAAAALAFGGTTALDFLTRVALGRGEHILINGAAGGVGTVAIALAKHHGAEVTAVCSATNADLVRALGADHVIDYAAADFAAGAARYDVVLDAVGNAPLARSRAVMKPRGRLVALVGSLGQTAAVPLQSMVGPFKVFAGPARERVADLLRLAELASLGVLVPVIDRVLPIEELVAAHRYVDAGHKRGNVVVTFAT